MGDKPSIETYLNELRSINQQLQQDDVRMDDAIALYEKGAMLAKEAYELLDGYKHKIESIEAATLQGGSE